MRTTLDRAEQIEALVSGARELDREARIDRRAIPRAAPLSTLMFSGVRIGEALALRWADVDLAAGRMRINDSKTEDLDDAPEKPAISREEDDGRGWFRTSDLSRVKSSRRKRKRRPKGLG
jgi:integrase